jgi:tight adherence protein B
MLYALLGVFFATMSACIGAFLYFNREHLSASQAARDRLRNIVEIRGDSTPSILRDDSASGLEPLNRLLTGKAITARLAHRLDEAGLDMKPGTFVILLPLSALMAMLVGGVFVGGVGAFWLLIGLAIPVLWVKRRRKQRLLGFEEQLPEAIDMLMSALRAGYSFQAATKFIGEEVGAPLGREFSQFYDEQRLGIDVRTALTSLQDRVPSNDLKMFVTAILIQRETGGNLTEVLGNIAEVMRERADVHRKIDALTAESKMSARMLALLPPIVFVLLLVFDPVFLRPVLVTTLGHLMLAYCALSVSVGYFIMMRLASVDV